jgi:6-phosphogluconolactonase
MSETSKTSNSTYGSHKSFYLLVGGYSDEQGRGIETYIFDCENGKLQYLKQSKAIESPSYFCCDDNNEFVYAISESENGSDAHVFSFDQATGGLTFINKEAVSGAAACYVSINKGRNHIFVANYKSGSLSVLLLKVDGSLSPVLQEIEDEGSSLNTERQEGPHVHAALLSPDQQYLLYTDLGTDEMHCCRYDTSQKAPLTLYSKIKIKPGSGPRHFVFSNDGRYVYLVTELSAEVLVLDYDNGRLKPVQTISMLADDFKGEPGGGDIRISSDGMYLYATNRGDANEIVLFSINPKDGHLELVQRCSSMGTSPRNLVIDPTGSYLLVANQESDSVVVFKLDKATGKIGDVVSIKMVEKPSCLKFVKGIHF